MTLGDIIEKVGGAFGAEPSKIRKLRERVTVVVGRIKDMEDGLRDVRKQVTALEGRVDDLKRELQVEKSTHNQDLIMDDIERLDKEFNRMRELANLKGLNVDAARTLRSKLEQLLETAVNGGSSMELEEVLDKVECMDEDLSDVRKLVEKLDRPTSSTRQETKEEAKTDDAAAERAARMARILGKPAPAVAPAAPAAPVATPAPAAAATAAPATPEAQPGVVATN